MMEILYSNRDNIAVLLFLVPAAIFDFKKLKIPVWFFIVGTGIDISVLCLDCLAGERTGEGILLSLLPGMLLLLAAVLTRGKIGIGDGMSMLILGVAAGFERTLLDVTGGLLLISAVGSAVVLLKKGNLQTRLPFIPFCLAAYGGILYAKL